MLAFPLLSILPLLCASFRAQVAATPVQSPLAQDEFVDGALHHDKSNNLGNLSPYHTAPNVWNVEEDLPDDCTVDQVMLMGRHGSRYPIGYELEMIQSLTYKLGNASDAITNATLPKSLQFLKEGYTTSLGTDTLQPPGRLQLFDHGVSFLLTYPHLKATTILSNDVDRVFESAEWFGQGYFGRVWSNISSSVHKVIPRSHHTPSWITPWETCSKWFSTSMEGGKASATWEKIYVPAITKRLNRLLPNVGLTDTDTLGALYACPYDLAAYGVSPWCDVFSSSEINAFEYDMDLIMNGAFSYGLPRNMAPRLGTLFVNRLIEHFSSATAQEVYLEFGHDATIILALTAMGLIKDIPPLPPTHPVKHRQFRTSHVVPFAAQMIFERFTCFSSFEGPGPHIRLLLNDVPLPLTTCAKTHRDRKYGTCSFDAFVEANAFSTSSKWGDEAWNSTCEDPGF